MHLKGNLLSIVALFFFTRYTDEGEHLPSNIVTSVANKANSTANKPGEFVHEQENLNLVSCFNRIREAAISSQSHLSIASRGDVNLENCFVILKCSYVIIKTQHSLYKPL